MSYWYAFVGICYREWLRFFSQRARFAASLVRPLLWLVVFAAGFRAALGIAIMEPYATYINYEEYILPGLCAMILLFNGMQSSLSIVYDREMGSIKVLLTSPLPRPFLLLSKQIASALVSVLQVGAFLVIAALYDRPLEPMGYVLVIPALFLVALMLSALGIVIASRIKQLENFAGVMNFVIFPMFFLSSALYPLWKMQEASLWLYEICRFNPFTFGVELIRFALYQQLNVTALLVVSGCTLAFVILAVVGFQPVKEQGKPGGKP
ncbi:multidrug ABC transporter permease [Grimontia sp. AD028]|uniref:ABC transporter permease n=1 Tax=Grimontia sp. AD028 TaxID=1581149 RepID=UPI00061AAC0E|nr:ABC transporter permease [Grimontia sp. AD028]KKD59513.1 multidrug ABC transporter permease [Grimontia sp. AD028]